LDNPDANTEAEVRQIAEDLRKSNFHSVIIVTSKAHTRRVRTIWRKLVGTEPRMIVHYAQDDTFDSAHWWRHTRDALDVMRETLGLLNAWAGFPCARARISHAGAPTPTERNRTANGSTSAAGHRFALPPTTPRRSLKANP